MPSCPVHVTLLLPVLLYFLNEINGDGDGEAQLMLTNPSNAFTGQSVKVTKHGTIRYVRYGFLLVFCYNFDPKTHRFFLFDFEILTL